MTNTNNAYHVQSTPKVSVTVVTYNHGEWLAECLESIVTQVTDFPFEVIVGDDASNDGKTTKILKDYAARYPHVIVPVIRERNINGTQNYLDIVRRTRGKYIAHIDGDDMMLPGKLQKQVDFLDCHPECSIVAHDVRVIDGSSGALISDSFENCKIPDIADVNYLIMTGCYFAHCSKMYRRAAIKNWERDRRTVDFFYHIEQAKSGDIGYLHEVLGVYRKSRATASDPVGPISNIVRQAYKEAFEHARELCIDETVVRRGEMRYKYSLALDFLRRGRRDLFLREIELDITDMDYASWKHKVVHYLRAYPRLVYRLMAIKGAS